MTPEFSRPERLDSIGERDRRISIAATPEECAALARRFDLIAIDCLAADLTLRREAHGIVVRGPVTASVVQTCAITDDPVPATIDEPMALRFVDAAAPEQDEIELSDQDCDTMPIDGGAIDLGEAAAETMALALDPFPRAPSAEAVLRDAGVISEEEARPLGALAGLKAALEKRQS
ncbi:DUF177 domain-containing protein [Sphingomonas koreensis]|nr:DUF177 domain-containing protein [Sphingomonas koreensis]